jgi:dTDP-glucose pyrophosphorylase
MMDKFLILENKTIQDALDQLYGAMGLGLIVVDNNQKLLGTVTDGDIRKGVIAGLGLDEKITKIMFENPITGNSATTDSEFKKYTEGSRIKLVPIVDNGIVIDIYSVDPEEMKDIPVVLMAGGLGSRLGDLTKDTPKPMLEVGGKPVLERIIDNFIRVGFRKFYISVNYKAEIIENYFGDGSKFNCEIEYLREKKRLGTAGSLNLLPSAISGPLVVTNGDLLTLVDYRALMDFHNSHKSRITMCTRHFNLQVPYGVVNVQDGVVLNMEEKPVHSFNVNAGVYVLDSLLVSQVPEDEYLDMPTFIESAMADNKVHCFPMVEKWIDIGKVSDLEFARDFYGNK